MAKKAISDFDRDELADAFSYLDDLRESGETNMFGAGPYVKRKFKLSDDGAKAVTLAWMRTFSRDKSPAERATAALTKAAA